MLSKNFLQFCWHFSISRSIYLVEEQMQIFNFLNWSAKRLIPVGNRVASVSYFLKNQKKKERNI
ncbi:hypothetical protein C680_02060 [Mycoplasmoides pneumoniae PO1]|nr:hypothetical protein C680_02060 [Mycoplasmoides pneumoniae PO1]